MVLAGSINKQMVGYINEAGGKAVGLCGKDGNMVIARKLTRAVVDPDSNIEKLVDLGYVGEPDKVDVTVLTQILGRELIPVLAPVCAAANGGTYNVNADTFAGAVAGALKAKRLLLLTDVPGVLDKSKNLIKQLSADEARGLIADGTISGGMIPKVETCIDALDRGVEGVVILDGKVPLCSGRQNAAFTNGRVTLLSSRTLRRRGWISRRASHISSASSARRSWRRVRMCRSCRWRARC
jgi:acetylglutamate kinase